MFRKCHTIGLSIFFVGALGSPHAANARDAECVRVAGKCEETITVPGAGKISPEYQTDTTEVTVPEPWLASNSFCYPVLYQLKTSLFRRDQNFHLWKKGNRWAFRAGQSNTKSLLHVRCFMPEKTVPPVRPIPFPVPVPASQPALLKGRFLAQLHTLIDSRDVAAGQQCHHPAVLTTKLSLLFNVKDKNAAGGASLVAGASIKPLNNAAACLCESLTGQRKFTGFWSKELGFIAFRDYNQTSNSIRRVAFDGNVRTGIIAEKEFEFSVSKVLCDLP